MYGMFQCNKRKLPILSCYIVKKIICTVVVLYSVELYLCLVLSWSIYLYFMQNLSKKVDNLCGVDRRWCELFSYRSFEKLNLCNGGQVSTRYHISATNCRKCHLL